MARSFNGTNTDYIALGNPAAISGISTAITCAGWVFPTSTSSEQKWLSRWDGGSNSFHFLMDQNSSHFLWAVELHIVGNINVQATGTISANQWYHHAGTYSSVSGNLIQYVNGAQDGTSGGHSAVLDSVSVNAFIGAGGDNLNTPPIQNIFGGSLADIGIWNIDLTPLEISALASGVRPGSIRPGNLIAWWTLDGIQSPEPDLSGNAINGTVNGTSLAFGPPLTLFTPRSRVMTPGRQSIPPKFRRTLSQIGGRAGARQRLAW